MENWQKIQGSFANLNIGQSASKFAKGFNSSVQATRERLGQVAPEEITELPQEYRDLEARVDALRNTHQTMLKITRVYDTQTYDYPSHIQESLTQLGTNINSGFHTIQSFAASNIKGVHAPQPSAPIEQQLKTLPHALGRAASSSAKALAETSNGQEDRLAKALELYADAFSHVAGARVTQDETISAQFNIPWSQTLSNSIAVAMKARSAVAASRLELDTAKQSFKSAAPAKQEQARLEVENAEDDLVQKTEVAITLMKTVLENPEPIKNLNELVKAQLAFHAASAEALSAIQDDIEELSVAAEGDYRKSRDH